MPTSKILGGSFEPLEAPYPTGLTRTLNFPSAENDTNLFIESFTLRDALQCRICIEKYPFIQVKFLCTNLFLCFV